MEVTRIPKKQSDVQVWRGQGGNQIVFQMSLRPIQRRGRLARRAHQWPEGPEGPEGPLGLNISV